MEEGTESRLSEAQLGFLEELEVDVEDAALTSIIETLVYDLRSHVCNTAVQMKWVYDVAKQLDKLRIAADELLDGDLIGKMLWGYEDKPPVITDPQIQATDIARIRTAVERRMGVSRAPPGVTPASGGSGGFTRTPSRMQSSCRTSTNFTTQLVNQFTKEIEQGIKPGDLRSHVGPVEYKSRMKKAWDRAVVETAGPWWVYRGSYANFEEAYAAGALKAVLAQKINNNNRKKKRADDKEDKAPPKAARTDEPLQPQQTNTNEPPTQPPGPTEQPAADSHASSLASADASQGFLLCGSLQNKENMEVIAVAMPMSTLLPQLRPTDRVSMTILRPLAKLGVSTLISVGGVTFNYTKNASSVPWPVAGIYSCFEDKTAASYGFTKEQIEKAMMK